MSTPWGALLIGAAIFGVVLWALLSKTESGAVNKYKAREQANAHKLRRELNEINRENDSRSPADKRDRLLDEYSRD